MKFRHILMAILVAAIWGFNFVAVKVGLQEIPPFLYGASRFIIAALPALFFKRPNVSWTLIAGIGLTLGVMKFTLMFMGIHLGVAAGLASLILQSQVFFTIGLSVYFYKARVSANHVLGMIIASLGIILIGWQMHAESTLIGFGMLFAAAISWSFSNILYRKAGNVDMFSLTVWTSVIPPIPMLIGDYLYEGGDSMVLALTSMTPISWLCLFYTACASTWIGATVWGMLLRTYEPHRVAPFSLLVPIFGMSFSSFILGEEFSTLISIACVLVFIGLIVNQWSPESNRDDDFYDDEKEAAIASDVQKAA